MMDHEGDESCIAREEMLRRDGTGNASRCRKKGFLERKTMSFGAESYELVSLTKGKQQGDTLLL